MGVLTPSNNEISFLQKTFEEKVKMIGVDGFYYEIKNHNLNKLSKWDNMNYFDPVEIAFLFEEMPNPKTLRGLNWWDDSDDSTPPIAYLPWHIDSDSNYELKPQIGSKIELIDPLGGLSRFYEIQEVNANTLYKVYSIVKLTPLREEIGMESEHSEEKGEKGTEYEFIHG